MWFARQSLSIQPEIEILFLTPLAQLFERAFDHIVFT